MKYELNVNGITLLNLRVVEDFVIISQFQEASKEIEILETLYIYIYIYIYDITELAEL